MDKATTTAAPERCLGGGTTSVFHPLVAGIWPPARSTAAVCCTRQSKANTHLVKASLWIMNENNSQQRTDEIEKDHRKRCVSKKTRIKEDAHRKRRASVPGCLDLTRQSFTWHCAAARRPEGLHIFHTVQMYFLKALLSPWYYSLQKGLQFQFLSLSSSRSFKRKHSQGATACKLRQQQEKKRRKINLSVPQHSFSVTF